jgi:hypothetical protein
MLTPTKNFLTTETPLLIQQDLYFGLNLPGGGEITQAQFQSFIDSVITPRFPAGLTIFDADERENTKVVSLFVENTGESEAAIDEVVEAYNKQFGVSALQVTNQDDLKVGFGVGENLINNDRIPELIQVDLFFGRNIAGVGEVSQEQFQAFVNSVITPRFPAGLTIFDTDGQFLSSTGRLIREPSKVVSLILDDTKANEAAIDEIVAAYIKQFQQESVLQAVNEDITVSFGPTDDLIDNDSIPELIQADLFFGRNIAGVGEVSEAQFQTFLEEIIAPLFSEFTVFDANGQFLNSAGTIIREQAKAVSLLIEDTEQNESSINDLVAEHD